MSTYPEEILLKEKQNQQSNQLHASVGQDANNPLLQQDASPSPSTSLNAGHGLVPEYGMSPPIMMQPSMQMQPPASVPDQPHLSEWMPTPQGILNCPPGLEYLAVVDQLVVEQQMKLLEGESVKKYEIRNTFGQRVYWAEEDITCWDRLCHKKSRAFDLKVLDYFQNEVLHLNRFDRAETCCFPCCLQKLEVSSPPGTVIGTVEQEWTLLLPNFRIKDQHGVTMLHVGGPRCECSLYSNVNYYVFSHDGTEVGMLTKESRGPPACRYDVAEKFIINFPIDMDVRLKAAMLGALFLIDYMVYEQYLP